MSQRCIDDLTASACSRKLDSHKAACALHFAYYNFCRIQESLRVIHPMESDLTDHILELTGVGAVSILGLGGCAGAFLLISIGQLFQTVIPWVRRTAIVVAIVSAIVMLFAIIKIVATQL